MREFKFKTTENGTKIVVWQEDLDVIVLTEREVKEFQTNFDSMEKAKQI